MFFGSTLSSETTAAAEGAVGVVRRDPMAMLPFIGYDAGDYLNHWDKLRELPAAQGGKNLPAVFLVNWFRRNADGGFAWPGFGENSRVLKWICDRIEGKAEATETPLGLIPAEGSLDLAGLEISDSDLEAATRFDVEEWKNELPLIEQWYENFGDHLPASMRAELDALRERLGA